MPSVQLTLYVAGETTRSLTAIANLRRLGETELEGAYELRIVDVTKEPDAADTARILTTPTLVREAPPPIRRVIGDLSDSRKVLVGLALDPDSDGSLSEMRR